MSTRVRSHLQRLTQTVYYEKLEVNACAAYSSWILMRIFSIKRHSFECAKFGYVEESFYDQCVLWNLSIFFFCLDMSRKQKRCSLNGSTEKHQHLNIFDLILFIFYSFFFFFLFGSFPNFRWNKLFGHCLSFLYVLLFYSRL